MDSDKSLTTTEKDYEKQLTEEESTNEEIILFQFEQEQCDVVFVFEGKTDKPLHCPSSFLNRISKEFQNNMVKADDGSHYEIKAEGFGVDALKKALAFYQPKYFEYFKDKLLKNCIYGGYVSLAHNLSSYPLDSDDFRGILTVCSKFELVGLKTKIQSYLMEEHDLIASQRIMLEPHFLLLQMAVDFGFDVLYDEIMSMKVGFSFVQYIASGLALNGINDELKYKIMKKCIRKDIADASSNYKNIVALEVISIFHFLDFFFHANKTLDYALQSKEDNSHTTSKTFQKDSSIFFEKNEINDVLVKVEGKDLFVNSTVLSDNSSVFKAMLNSTFKEGLENVIELPGKRAEDIIELFKSLTEGKKITEYNAFRLLPLCREYQVDWLQDLIQEQIMKLQFISNRLRLEYLNLCHDMSFLKGEEHFVNSLRESFIQLQRYKEFNDLKDETKLLVTLRRLWYVYIYCCVQTKPASSESIFTFNSYQEPLTYLFNTDLGFPSIFENVMNVPFYLNAEEEVIICSLNNQNNRQLPQFKKQQARKQHQFTPTSFGSQTVGVTYNMAPFLIVGQDW